MNFRDNVIWHGKWNFASMLDDIVDSSRAASCARNLSFLRWWMEVLYIVQFERNLPAWQTSNGRTGDYAFSTLRSQLSMSTTYQPHAVCAKKRCSSVCSLSCNILKTKREIPVGNQLTIIMNQFYFAPYPWQVLCRKQERCMCQLSNEPFSKAVSRDNQMDAVLTGLRYFVRVVTDCGFIYCVRCDVWNLFDRRRSRRLALPSIFASFNAEVSRSCESEWQTTYCEWQNCATNSDSKNIENTLSFVDNPRALCETDLLHDKLFTVLMASSIASLLNAPVLIHHEHGRQRP